VLYSVVFGICWIAEKYSLCYNINNEVWEKMLKLQYVVSKPAQHRAVDADSEAVTTSQIARYAKYGKTTSHEMYSR
jgi:hypothetical protein